MPDNDKFKAWLMDVKSFSKEVASDNASRVNRVLKFIDFYPDDTPIDVRYRLDKNDTFNALSSTVKSQLKRASILYIEWSNSLSENSDDEFNPTKR